MPDTRLTADSPTAAAPARDLARAPSGTEPAARTPLAGRLRLALYASGMVPLVFLALVIVGLVVSFEVDRQRVALGKEAAKAAAALAGVHASVVASLQAVGGLQAYQGGSDAERRTMLDALVLTHAGIVEIIEVDGIGRAITRSRIREADAGPYFPENTGLMRRLPAARALSAPLSSEIWRDGRTGGVWFSLAVPLGAPPAANAADARSLVARVDPTRAPGVQPGSADADRAPVFINGAGEMILDPSRPADQAPRILRLDPRAWFHKPPDGGWMLSGQSPVNVAGLNLTAVVQRPAAVVVSALVAPALVWVAALMLAVTLAWLFGRWVQGAVSHPLQALDDAMRRSAAGDFRQRVEVRSTDEIGQVSSHFNGLCEQMTDTVSALEEEIARHKRTAKNLADAKEQAIFANSAKSMFLANMSHELRTPLNAAIGFSEALMLEIFVPLGHSRYKEYARDIQTSCLHLLGLINDILDLSKIETGEMSLEEEVIGIAALLNEAVKMTETKAIANGLSLRIEIAEPAMDVLADRRKLRQILLNLLSNAIKFTPAEGGVVIGADRTGDGELRIFVTDTGIGIPGHQIQAVWQPFTQIDNVMTRRSEGTGLGLSIVRSLAEMHGGRVYLDSAPNKGTTISVILPNSRILGRR